MTLFGGIPLIDRGRPLTAEQVVDRVGLHRTAVPLTERHRMLHEGALIVLHPRTHEDVIMEWVDANEADRRSRIATAFSPDPSNPVRMRVMGLLMETDTALRLDEMRLRYEEVLLP